MTALTGLFAAALADPGLARVRDLARSGAAQVDGLDLTAPPALWRSPPPAARPRISSPRWAACCRPSRWRSSRAGRRCRTSDSPHAPTPSAGGWPCCAGSRTRTRRTRTGAPARFGWWWPPSARCCNPSSRGSAIWNRSGWPPVTRPTWSRSPAGSPTWRTPASTWSPSGASSPCAAASWTSSRPPTSTRPGSSSGATRWRRSAPSPSPTSAPSSRSPSSGPRPAGNFCSPPRSGSGPPSSRSSTRSWPRSWTSWPAGCR